MSTLTVKRYVVCSLKIMYTCWGIDWLQSFLFYIYIFLYIIFYHDPLYSNFKLPMAEQAYDSHSISSCTYCLSLWFLLPFSGYLFSWIRIYSRVLSAHFFPWELHMGNTLLPGVALSCTPWTYSRSQLALICLRYVLFVPSCWELPWRSAPFARRSSGVTLWCLNPIYSANALTSTELKGGLLSLSGIPCVANTFPACRKLPDTMLK